MLSRASANLRKRMMEKDYLVFDLETQRDIQSVGGYQNIHQLKMSVGVVFDSTSGSFETYYEADVEQLKAKLTSGPKVVGFNHLLFDYVVLSGYGDNQKKELSKLLAAPNLDLMKDLQATLGHRLSLSSLVVPTLAAEKSADGLDALKWYREYSLTGDLNLLKRIASYCQKDVELTKQLYLYGLEHKKVFFISKNEMLRSVEVAWQKSERKKEEKQPTTQQANLF